MSDATEENPTNGYLNLSWIDANDEPTSSTGTRSNGHLVNGLNLRDRSGVCGYKHYLGTDPQDTDDWGISPTLRVIEEVARLWAYTHDYYIATGDISLRFGGYFDPHSEHQTGRDIDVRYVREDHNPDLPVSRDPNDDSYGPIDVEATKALINWFALQSDVSSILVYFTVDVTPNAKIQFRTIDHADHFHVRIAGP
jgi:hypothetical protein